MILAVKIYTAESDEPVGTITWDEDDDFSIDPPDSVLLKNILKEPVFIDGQEDLYATDDGSTFMLNLHKHYKSAYLRASEAEEVDEILTLHGGPGSGNFGHGGREGEVGGSSSGDGGASAEEPKKDPKAAMKAIKDAAEAPKPDNDRKGLDGTYMKVPFGKPPASSEIREELRSTMRSGSSSQESVLIAELTPTQSVLRKGSMEHFVTKQPKADPREPIVVVEHEGKKYLFDGTHRTAAEHLLGGKTVTAKVYRKK